MTCLYGTGYKYLAKGRQFYLPFSFVYNSDITPFAMCTTEIEAEMVQINVGFEILCDRVYFILYKKKKGNVTEVALTLHLPFAFTLETDSTFRVTGCKECDC